MSGTGRAFVVPILLGIGVAVAGRGAELALRRRRFPTYPHGQVVHLFLGFLAGVLGSLAVPSVLTADYTAGVFLALGTQQFHTVRSQERATLLHLDEESRVPRGRAYIENIAQTFEARNFLLFATALVTTWGAHALGPPWGVAMGAAAFAASHVFLRSRRVGEVATVAVAPAASEDDDPGLVITLRPRDDRAAAVLRNPGQRQALAHDLYAMLGARVGAEGEERRPEVRVDERDGSVTIRLWPVDDDPALAARAAAGVPLLESVAGPLRATARRARA